MTIQDESSGPADPLKDLSADYRHGVLHLAFERDRKTGQGTLLFSFVELIPAEIPPPIDDFDPKASHCSCPLPGGKHHLYVRHLPVSARAPRLGPLPSRSPRQSLQCSNAAMQQCLSCLDAGWFSCLDAAVPLRAIGVDTALNRETETPKISGAAHGKSRKKLIASITALMKQIGKTCTGQPGEWDKASKDKVTDLQDTAWALDPPDDTINFAPDVLDGAAECTGNSEHYRHLVTRALERTAAR